MFFFLSRKETYIFSAVKSNIVVVPLSKTTVRLCHLSSCGSYPERVEATKVSWFVFSALPIKPECQNHIRSPSRQVRMRLRLIHCWHACPYQLAETMPLLRGLGSCYGMEKPHRGIACGHRHSGDGTMSVRYTEKIHGTIFIGYSIFNSP
jgi:hypothetical protein